MRNGAAVGHARRTQRPLVRPYSRTKLVIYVKNIELPPACLHDISS